MSVRAGALRTRARISAHVLFDHLTDPSALVLGELPWRPEAITPEWLTSILCADRPGVRVARVRVVAHSAGSSVRRRLEVEYSPAVAESGLPPALFAKSTPSVLTRLSSGMVADREGGFFRDIRPHLKLEAPSWYYSGHDDASGRTLHLFEDIALTRGAKFCGYATKITRSQADDIVDLLATLHGSLYASPRLGTDFPWLTDYEVYARTFERNGSQAVHERAMLLARDVVPARLFARKDEIWPAFKRGLAAHAEEPRTLIHSDVHLGNWYVTAAGRMGLADWALVCRGHWARDVAYALSTMLAPEDRRAWERSLLERYLERLGRTTAAAVPSFEHAWRRYRQQAFAALMMWTPTLVPAPTNPEMQPVAMSREMIRRITAAIDDLGSLDAHGGG